MTYNIVSENKKQSYDLNIRHFKNCFVLRTLLSDLLQYCGNFLYGDSFHQMLKFSGTNFSERETFSNRQLLQTWQTILRYRIEQMISI